MYKMMENNWNYLLRVEFEKPYFIEMQNRIKEMRFNGTTIYPMSFDVFKAFDLCPPWNIKVVILGQDPYHDGSATGLAFSVRDSAKHPKSLTNIFRALKIDSGIENKSGDLSYWAIQGVFLLNTILTVEKGKPLSHKNLGWETFTDEVVRIVNDLKQPIVWVLWGKLAQQKKHLITNSNHLILEAAHPSPMSAHKGFFWCKHFSKVNEFLKKNKQDTIYWRLP